MVLSLNSKCAWAPGFSDMPRLAVHVHIEHGFSKSAVLSNKITWPISMLCPMLFFLLFPTTTLTTQLDNSLTNQFGSPNPTHISRGGLTSCSFQTSIHKTTCLPAEYKSLVPTSPTIMLL